MDNRAQQYQEAIAEQLRAERAARGLTIEGLTAKTTLHKSSVVRYLDGDRDIKMSALFELAAALELPVPELLTRAEQRISDK